MLTGRSIDLVSFDVMDTTSAGSTPKTAVYNRLLRQAPGYLEPPAVAFEGDLAQSWEFSPDGLTMTLKLRPIAKFHDIPPVNGHEVEAEDIVKSWERFVEVGTINTRYANSVNPNAPIVSLEAIDAKTVRLNLAFPMATILGTLATEASGLYFDAREAAIDYDANTKAIGAGPWKMDEYQPSIKVVYSRNEGYFDADNIFIDRWEEIIVPEYAARLAQYQTGAIYMPNDPGTPLNQEDILRIKNEVPDIEVHVLEPPSNHGILKWGWDPSMDTPFRDKRLRQALSTSIDRELFLNTIYNTDRFAAEGIDLGQFWHTCIPANFGKDYMLDPRTDEGFKYYQYDPEEARALIEAAGVGDNFAPRMNFTTGYGDRHATEVQLIMNFGTEVGINFEPYSAGFTTDFRPDYANRQGDFPGVTARFRPAGGIFHPVEMMFTEYVPAPGIEFTGFFAEGSNWKDGDPAYTDLLSKARVDFDVEKQKSLMAEFQRMEAENFYQFSFPGTTEILGTNWPAIRNFNVWTGGTPRGLYLWLDDSREPL
jgi:peptide/nickel transport system substrate-binding protein